MKVSDALDANFIYAGDLDGREVTLIMERVADKGTVKRADGRMVDKEVAYFEKTKRGLILNTTNLRRLQLTHGNDMAKWPGKKVTLYPTTTETTTSMAQEAGCAILSTRGKKAVVPCIRVKVPAELFEAVPLGLASNSREAEIEF